MKTTDNKAFSYPDMVVLGSTGSVGEQAIDVALSHGIRVRALSARSSVARVEEQARALLANYLRPVSLELWRVQDCYSLGANEYRIELIHPDTAPVDALIEAYGTYDSLLCAGELYVKLNSSGGLNRLIYDMAVFVYPTASGSPSYEIDYHVDCKNYNDTVY